MVPRIVNFRDPKKGGLLLSKKDFLLFLSDSILLMKLLQVKGLRKIVRKNTSVKNLFAFTI